MPEPWREEARRAYEEEKGKEKFRKGYWGWSSYVAKEWIAKYGVTLLLIGFVILIVYLIAGGGMAGTLRTRAEVGLEKSTIPEKITVGFRDTMTKIENFVLGFGEWKSPSAKEKREPRGIKIEEFKPRKDMPYRTDEDVEAVASVRVYALDPEDFGSSTISFNCGYDGGENGEIVVDGIETDKVYAANNEETIFNVRCKLLGVSWEGSEEAIVKKINFEAGYSDFTTISTLHVGVLNEEQYSEEEKQGSLLDFLRKHSGYPSLIKADRSVISEYTKGPVKLALTTDKQPLTENREYSFFISFIPEISDWTGEIKPKSIELSKLSEVFVIKKCDFETSNLWEEDNLQGCEKSCQRACDFNVVGVNEFAEYDVKARATYDYTVKATTTVDIRKVA